MQNKSQLKHGINGLPYFELRHPSGAQLNICLHGAHVTSWQDKDGKELLFMSKKSFFQADKPIRGGIPIVFPQFGDGPLPKHGFTRIQEWTLLETSLTNDGRAEAEFELKDNPDTFRLWPHKFRLELIYRLGEAEFEISFAVANTGNAELEFKNGLHTYFSAADINRVSIAGMAGADFIDLVGDKTVQRETREKITFERETDRVYPSAPDRVVLDDEGNRQKIIIEKRGMNDIVIWNPWAEKSKRMEDFWDEEYLKMVCIETGNLHQPLCLAPGAVHDSSTKFISQKKL